MLLAADDLAAIRDGRVDLAFRRWRRPSVKAGTQLRTTAGIVEVIAVAQVEEAGITEDDARRAGADDRAALLLRLARYPDGDLYRITLRPGGDDPRVALRDQVPYDPAPLLDRLARLDRASATGPWTGAILALIAAHEGRRAADLAAELGREMLAFKRDVRKLKELGLTESLGVGYRLSARGRAVLAALSPARS
ncbi:MAG: hypothetical protein J0H08_02470 [Rhizobiales bacterium]|nr:hypothetical protein [Hyphomicrobiales bacterium]